MTTHGIDSAEKFITDGTRSALFPDRKRGFGVVRWVTGPCIQQHIIPCCRLDLTYQMTDDGRTKCIMYDCGMRSLFAYLLNQRPRNNLQDDGMWTSISTAVI